MEKIFQSKTGNFQTGFKRLQIESLFEIGWDTMENRELLSLYFLWFFVSESKPTSNLVLQSVSHYVAKDDAISWVNWGRLADQR